MKIISVFVLFVTLGVFANAQEPKPAPEARPAAEAKIVSEIASSSTIKNSPFSAEAISESVQMLSDGNRIVRSSTSKLYRNSEGRFRREITGGSGGMLGSLYTYGQGVTLVDPVGGYRYMIDPNLKTTRQMIYKPHNDIRIVTMPGAKSPEGGVVEGKLRDEIKAAAGARGQGGVVVSSDKLKEEIRAVVTAAPAALARAVTGQVMTEALTGVGMTYAIGSHSKWETRTEELGVQNIEGVEAEGTRTITTIPAGAIGNERPIEITYEKWFSRDLQLVVMSKHNDPRFGEQTYRLTNIVRSEPDPSLFTPPQGYKLITEPGSGIYKISARNAAMIEKNAAMIEKAAAKAAQAATTVTKTKP